MASCLSGRRPVCLVGDFNQGNFMKGHSIHSKRGHVAGSSATGLSAYETST